MMTVAQRRGDVAGAVFVAYTYHCGPSVLAG